MATLYVIFMAEDYIKTYRQNHRFVQNGYNKYRSNSYRIRFGDVAAILMGLFILSQYLSSDAPFKSPNLNIMQSEISKAAENSKHTLAQIESSAPHHRVAVYKGGEYSNSNNYQSAAGYISTEIEKSAYYPNCKAAWEAGAAPIYKGEPGYREGMDGDHDGIACEPYRSR